MLVSRNINICISTENMICDIRFHRMLEHHTAQLLFQNCKLAFEHFTEYTWKVCTGILCADISNIEVDCLLQKLTLTFAVVDFIIDFDFIFGFRREPKAMLLFPLLDIISSISVYDPATNPVIMRFCGNTDPEAG